MPFAVFESDPSLFTTLVRTLGVQGLRVVELYDTEPRASDRPHLAQARRNDNSVPPKKKSCGL